MSISFIPLVVTSPGVELATQMELREFSVQSKIIRPGRLSILGDAELIPKLNLQLRTAERVLCEVWREPTGSLDEIFECTKALPWEDLLAKDAAFPVRASLIGSSLTSVPTLQRTVKKAIALRLGEKFGVSRVPEDGHEIPIEVFLDTGMCSIALDSSGGALHRRGYRTATGEAPLKETLAAALLYFSGWTAEVPLLDPMCGSGTILIEAALKANRVAPGLGKKFAGQAFPFLEESVWRDAEQKAQAQCREVPFEVEGSDQDAEVLSLARKNAEAAGLKDKITFTRRPLKACKPREGRQMVIVNPPYGKRLGDRSDVRIVARELGELKRRSAHLQLNVLTGDETFEKRFGERAQKRFSLRNGALNVTFFQF